MTTQAKRSTLKNRADRLFSEMIRKRDGVCQAGPEDGDCLGALQCAHLVSRRYHSTRWDPDNAIALCQGHHMRWTHDVAGWELWRLKRYGYDAVVELYQRAQVPWDKDIDAVLERLKGA